MTINHNIHKREVVKQMKGIIKRKRTQKTSRRSSPIYTLIMVTILLTFFISGASEAANSTSAGIVSAWASGTTSIKVKMTYTGDDNGNNTYTIKWKLCTDGSYPPGNVINGSHTASPYIAEITGLTANTCYNIEGTYNDADGVTGVNPQTLKIYSTWDSTLLHNSNRFQGTTKWGGNWGTSTGQYGQFVCGTCHEPRASNIKGIKSTITAPSGNFPGGTVNFQSTTSPNGFGDDTGGHTTSTKICEVCHSITNYHRYNTTGQSNLSHNNNADCTQCHPHATGFYYATSACDSCHGNPPTTASIGGPTGLATPATGATNPLSPGAHAVHVSTRGMTCDACHRGTAMPASEKKIDMGFSISGTTYPGFQNTVESGTFTGYNALSNGYTWNNSWPGTTVNTAANYANRCSSIYCHGSTLTGGTNTQPSWVGGSAEAACGTCHGASASAPPTTGSHTKHASSASGNLNLACTKCHPSVTDGSHVNGSVAWDLDDTDTRIGASATYRGSNAGQTGQLAPSASYGNCSNIYCHSTVQPNGGGAGAPTYATPTWGGTVNCGSCHVDMSTSPSATGSHIKHAQTQGYACSVCHSGAGSGTTLHANRNIEVTFSGIAAGGSYSQSSNPPGNGYGTCSTVYCHGTTTPTWGGAALTCGDCHYGNSTLAGKHSVHYATTTVATSSSFTPSNSSTTSAYVYTCGVCHNATNHAAGPVSTNQAAQVSFDSTIAGGGTYTAGGSLAGTDRGFNWTAGSCSSTYCHSNGAGGAPNNTTFNWNSAAGTLTCAGCHSYTKASGTPIATGSHTAHINNADAALGTFNCYQCHYATTTNDTAITDKTKHINKTKDVAFNTTLNPSGTYTSPNCSNLYCHSTGNISAPTANLPAAYGGSHYTTMAWNGSAIGCNGCHGKTVTAGAPDYTNQGAGQPGANSHMKHTSTGTDSTSCDTCHTNTTNTGTSIKAGSILHINNARDVTFNTTKAGASATYTAGTKTCSNIACHGNAQWGATLGCTDCHNATVSSPVAQGLGGPATRRNVVAEFAQASSHKRSAGGTVTNNDCGVCHMEGDPSTGTTTSYHRDGYIDLRDPDTGGQITQAQWSGTGAGSLTATTTTARFLQFSRDLTKDLQTDTNYLNLAGIELNHCLKCHDSGGAGSTLARVPGGSATNPFGGTGTPIDVSSQFATTNRSYHPVLGKQNNSYAANTRMNAPWNITKTNGTTTSWGLLMTCWDCHAPNGATGTLTSTVTAHGAAKTAPGTVYVELRGSVWMTGGVSSTNNTTLCIICHAGYDTNTSPNHGTGTAFTSNANNGMTLYLRYACYYCHAGNNAGGIGGIVIPTTRADAAADVHGSSTRKGGTAFAQTKYGYGFIRSEGFYANGYYQQPLSVGGTSTGGAQCTGFNGSNGTTSCSRNSMGTYTPGGVY